MSVNCIQCVVNKRTGPDLLCDECRETADPKTQDSGETPNGGSLHRIVVLRVSEAFGAEYARGASAQPMIQEMKQALKSGKRVRLCRVAGYPLFVFDDK